MNLRMAALKTLAAFLILTLLLPARAAPQSALAASLSAPGIPPAELETWCDDLMARQMAEYHIPGAALAVVQDGDVLLSKGWGFADLEGETPVDAERTLFRIASVTKLFTWTAVMQLVERGVLRLDADVNDYLPDFQIPPTYSQPVTLAHLMAHTAGFEDRGIGTLASTAMPAQPLSDYLAQNMPARVRPPGEISMYSNYGAALAGYIVARATGMDYEQTIETNILGPLAMQHSTVRQPVPEPLRAGLAQSYAFVGGSYRATSFAIDRMPPAGAISASAGDMTHFMLAHLQGGRYAGVQLLGEAAALRMHTQSFTHHAQLPGWAHGFQEMDINGRRALFHDGSLQNYVSLLLLSPRDHLGIFVVYNSGGGGRALDEFLQAFFDRYYPDSNNVKPQPVSAANPPGAVLAGSYASARRPYTTIEVLTRDMPAAELSVMGDGTLNFLGREWTPVGPLLYQASEDGDKLAFLTDERGRVTGAALGALALDKLRWHELPQVRLAGAFACLLLLLSGLIGWPLAAFIRRARRMPPLDPPARFARWFAGAAAALAVFEIIALVVMLGQPLIYAVPPGLRVLSLILYALDVLSMGVLLLAARAWVLGRWSIAMRVHYSLVAVGLLGLVGLMALYNLCRL